MENFGKPISEISKTEYGNIVVNNESNMISFDDVAKYFNKANN